METTKTLREQFEEKFLGPKHSSFQLFSDKYSEPGKLGFMMEDIITFIEQVDKLAEERGRQEAKTKDLDLISEDFEERHRLLEEGRQEGRQEMKQRCLECVPKPTIPSIEDRHFDVQYRAIENALSECIRKAIESLE